MERTQKQNNGEKPEDRREGKKGLISADDFSSTDEGSCLHLHVLKKTVGNSEGRAPSGIKCALNETLVFTHGLISSRLVTSLNFSFFTFELGLRRSVLHTCRNYKYYI